MNLNQLVKRKAQRSLAMSETERLVEVAQHNNREAIKRFERDAMRVKAMVKCHAILASDLHNQQGGSTTRVGENEPITSGFAVSIFPEAEQILPYAKLDGVGQVKLEEFITRNITRLAEPQYCLGTWAHEGKSYLDVVIVVENHEEARELAKCYGQLAYFDLAKGEEINVCA